MRISRPRTPRLVWLAAPLALALSAMRMEELRRESLLVDLRQRIRDVRQGSDELLYVLTDHPSDGAVLRIEPAS